MRQIIQVVDVRFVLVNISMEVLQRKNKIETCDARALVEIVIYTFLLKSVSNVINSLIPQVTQDALLSPNDRQTKTASLNYNASKAC